MRSIRPSWFGQKGAVHIVQQIAGLHQGTITVASEPGVGTAMTLRLPRHPARGAVAATATVVAYG